MILLSLLSLSCSKKNADVARDPTAPAKLSSGSWVPTVTGAGSSNSKGTVTTTKMDLYYSNVPMVRLNEGWSGKEYTVDLGNYTSTTFGNADSMTLIAEVTNYPFEGGAYPVLSSFYVIDGSNVTTEYVNLNSTCSTSGMFTCGGGYCSSNGCSVQGSGSSFLNRNDWDQHQIPTFGYTTTNSFPHCDPTANSWSTCPSGYGTLKSGHYYARYILLSDSGSSVAGQLVNLKVTKILKQDSGSRGIASATNGSIDLNVILVGNVNIQDSQTPKGSQNLNLLYGEVNSILKAGTGIGIGNIRVFEWADADGGSQWTAPDYSDLGTMFHAGSAGINLADPSLEGKAINVFMVRDITNGGNTSSTILGLSGGILGPITNGTQTSGLAFSTHITGVASGRIAGYNPSCTLSSCPRNSQEDGFLEMGATIAHELGHFLGLNHPSERKTSLGSTQRHDQLSDTPQCLENTSADGSDFLSQLDCYNDSTSTLSGQTCAAACDTAIQTGVPGGHYFNAGNTNPYNPNNYCPTTPQCQFNHLMWYTTKNRTKVGGVWKEDGNLLSTQSSALIQWNAFVR